MAAIMFRLSSDGARQSGLARRWAIRIAIACLALEAVYLIVGNLCLRMGVLESIINYKPEADFVSWESGLSFFPGCASFKGFTYRGQTRDSQMYIYLAEADMRISLIELLSKTVHVKGLDARDMDFRSRKRIDNPCWTEDSGEPFPGTPTNIEYYPEIPGYENPPDPKPEDLYAAETESKPWTVRISGAHIEGAIRVASKATRINGEGWVDGGVTVVLGHTNSINQGKFRIVPTKVVVGSTVLTEDLNVSGEIRTNPFPMECADRSQIVDGLSGILTFAGSNSNGFPVNVMAFAPLLPGQGMLSIESGTGELGGRLEFKEGGGAAGQLDLVADDVILNRQDTLIQGDLAVHASLSEGNLTTGRFDVSGTTFHLSDIAKMESSTKKQEKLEPWFGKLEFEEGTVTFGEPMSMDSHVWLTMHDTLPVLILLKKFTDDLKWLSLTRIVKGIGGTMDLSFGKGFVAVDDLDLTGEDVEILGWVHTRNQKKTGRVFARHGRRAAGVAFDEGKSKLILTRPRRWFEKQQRPSSSGSQKAAVESGG